MDQLTDRNSVVTGTPSGASAAALLEEFAARGIRPRVELMPEGVRIVWQLSSMADVDAARLREEWEAVKALELERWSQVREVSREEASRVPTVPFPAVSLAAPPSSGEPDASAPGSETPPRVPGVPTAVRAAEVTPSDREPTEADRAALANWRVEVRPGRPPVPLPPGNTEEFLELLRRSALRGAVRDW